MTKHPYTHTTLHILISQSIAVFIPPPLFPFWKIKQTREVTIRIPLIEAKIISTIGCSLQCIAIFFSKKQIFIQLKPTWNLSDFPFKGRRSQAHGNKNCHHADTRRDLIAENLVVKIICSLLSCFVALLLLPFVGESVEAGPREREDRNKKSWAETSTFSIDLKWNWPALRISANIFV